MHSRTLWKDCKYMYIAQTMNRVIISVESVLVAVRTGILDKTVTSVRYVNNNREQIMQYFNLNTQFFFGLIQY